MITLTVAEIVDLVACAGLVLKDGCEPDADELETEITIEDCPKEGVRDDEGRFGIYSRIAYFTEYPEEGCFPLGQELPAAYICPAGCGCLWRDNGNGTMSLFNGLEESCSVCETLPLSKLRPLTVEELGREVNGHTFLGEPAISQGL